MESQKQGTGSDLNARQLRYRLDKAWHAFDGLTEADAVLLLKKLVDKVEDSWGGSTSSFRPTGSEMQCLKCKDFLSGLNALPIFTGTKLPVAVRNVQLQIDGLVRRQTASQADAAQLGYVMGTKRWSKAEHPDEMVASGGRPSLINRKEVIATVQAALEKHSQPSSSICKKADGWTVANTMTDVPASIYRNEAALYGTISEATFRRILSKHLSEFKPARCLTDFCQHCADLETKVLPAIRTAMEKATACLKGMMPLYFDRWTAYVSESNLSFESQPGKFLSEFEHFIHRHTETKPCSRHVRTQFPCGCFDLRKRGSAFPQNQRVQLHEEEALQAHELRCHLKLLQAYLHHRAAKEHQHTSLTDLLERPPLGTAILLSDWKELETLPLTWLTTGDQFFAQARKEVSIWGALLIEHHSASTADAPKRLRTYFVVVSPILDHTSLRTNQLIRIALAKKKSSMPWKKICLVSDCGPHYRSMEAIGHGLVSCFQDFSIPMEVHFGCEKHMKSSIDRLFGWCRAILKRCRDRRQDILEEDSLVTALQRGFAENKEQNHEAPVVECFLDNSAIPKKSIVLDIPHLKISRTYCLSSVANRLRPTEPRIYNHVFSHKPTAAELEYRILDGALPTQWRIGYWGTSKEAWAGQPQPLKVSEENTLSRRFLAQKQFIPSSLERRRYLLPDMEEAARKRAKQLERAQRRGQAQREVLAQKQRRLRQNPRSSSSSSASAATSDSSESI